MTREEAQLEAMRLASEYNKLLLQWATGVGKSYAFIRIQEMLNVESTVIVVAEIAHIQNWKDEYIKHGKQYLLEKTKIFCYASLKNNIDISVDLLCLDEGHHAAADVSIACLATIKAKKLIVLTATITMERLITIQDVFGSIYNFKITLKQAIDWKIIPEPKIYVIPLELRKYLQTETFTWTRGNKKNRVTIHCKYHERWGYITNKSKYPNLELIVSCTEEEKNIYLCGQIAYYKQQYLDTRTQGYKNKWMLLSIERKRFLGDCKTELVKPFINVLKAANKRFICFCSSIEQANCIGGNNAIHSNMVDSNAAECIDSFNNKEIDRLYAVNMLQEGQNLVDIDAGVIIQLDAQDKGFVQKSGRALRAKEPVLLVFYYKNTRDQEYMLNIASGVSSEFIQVISSPEELVL